MRYMKTDLERFVIQNRTYYKEGELPVSDDDKCIADAIWTIKNVKGDHFKLIIRKGRRTTYSLYDEKGSLVTRPRSVRKVER